MRAPTLSRDPPAAKSRVVAVHRARMWRVPAGCALHWRFWGEEAVVYASGPGDTHLLNPFGVTVLQCLDEGAADLATLTGRVAQTLGVAADQALTEAVDRLLASLAGIGLAERAPG